jgi:hypothetical protein
MELNTTPYRAIRLLYLYARIHVGQVKEGEMGRACSRNRIEEECMYVTGGKARGQETTRKT